MTSTQRRPLPGLVRLPHHPSLWTLRAARVLGAFAIVVFAALIVREGIPRSFEVAQWEVLTQVAALLICILAYGLAWRWEGVGGVLMLSGAILLGVLASIQYTPVQAFWGALGFFIPGALFLLYWQQHHHPAYFGIALVFLALLLAGGREASQNVYDTYYGPTHPESHVELPAVDLVEWAWAGAVSEQGFAVNAHLADDVRGARLVVSTSADLSSPQVVEGSISRDGDNLDVRFTVTGLVPDTVYHYAVSAGDTIDTGRRGSVRTFPAGAASFTVAIGSCIRTGSNGSVFDRVREANPLLFIISGDWQYENISEDDPAALRDAYDRNLSAAAQEALYLLAPIVYTWDDHDYGGDGADRTAAARPAAIEVYNQRVPHYTLESSEGAIYQAYTIGRVRFIQTDSRSMRDPATDPDRPGKSMLGDEQKAWLKRELLAARDSAAVIAWVNGVPWISSSTAGDDWGAYATERQELANFIEENGISQLVMISGDAHMLAIDDGSNNTFAKSGKPSFPVFHAAALDRKGHEKGGPYSEGAYPGGGQYGLMTVTDDGGSSVTISWEGRDWEDTPIVSYTFTIPVATR